MGAGVTAIFPGSFDPVTLGHLDLIRRGRGLFGHIVVSVLVNPAKNPLFNLEERLEMLSQATADWSDVEVDSFQGLLVEYATRRRAQVVLRGVRSGSEFGYEAQMARMNNHLCNGLETVFMAPSEGLSYISSSLVREVAQLGGSLKGLVPSAVEERVRARLGR